MSDKKQNGRFEGDYFKHYNNGKTVAFIPGIDSSGGNIQVITDKKSYYFDFPSGKMGKKITVGNNEFSNKGLRVDLPDIKGEIKYGKNTPIKFDFMGILKFFPLECRHEIISMKHKLSGSLTIEGEKYDFNGGVGYHEKDSGTSFPKKHLWLQCNNFEEKDCSIMLSIAQVPIFGANLRGSICIIILDGKEYRLSTYFGATTDLSDDSITIKQLNLRIVVDIIDGGKMIPLSSAVEGSMSGELLETNDAKMRFRFYKSGKKIFDLQSDHVGFERRNI